MERTMGIAFFFFACLLVTAILLSGDPSYGQGEKANVEAIRDKVEGIADAIITVKVVSKQQITMRGRPFRKTENKMEVTGTVIDETGLTVVSLLSIEPASIFSGLGLGGMRGFHVESEPTDVKLVLKDGKEIRGKIVLRDKDLDLAFVRPEEKGLKFSFLSLEEQKTEARILDEVVTLWRLPRFVNRELSVCLNRVSAVAKKPRLLYLLATQLGQGALGGPVLDPSGKVLGITLTKKDPSGAGKSLLAMAAGMTTVVLPAEDIQEAAKQAPQVEEVEEEPAEPEGEPEKEPEKKPEKAPEKEPEKEPEKAPEKEPEKAPEKKPEEKPEKKKGEM
jgi:S1-C subfamily serine protease